LDEKQKGRRQEAGGRRQEAGGGRGVYISFRIAILTLFN